MLKLNLKKYEYTQDWFLKSEMINILLDHVNPKSKINILEIGCFEGLSSSILADNLLNHAYSTFDCVDPYIKSGTDPENTCAFVDDDVKRKFLDNISKSKNAKKIIFHNQKSEDFFKHNTKLFNFVYIDGCHEQKFIQIDLEGSYKFLQVGGIIWCDDYLRNNGIVKETIDNFLKDKKDLIIIHSGKQIGFKRI